MFIDLRRLSAGGMSTDPALLLGEKLGPRSNELRNYNHLNYYTASPTCKSSQGHCAAALNMSTYALLDQTEEGTKADQSAEATFL